LKLSQVADITEEGRQLELAREDLRQLAAVTAALEDRDLGGATLEEVLARSGRMRLRPILITSPAVLPLALGIDHGADMLRPLSIGIFGALCISMLFSSSPLRRSTA
jgi:multidrug efflux pump subunit AcrB